MKSQHTAQHESEWIYSSPLSKQLLTTFNENVHHELSSVPHPIELLIASCGYAFNPVMVPFWLGFIYALTYRGLSSSNILSSDESLLTASPRGSNKGWRDELATLSPEHGALINTIMYLISILVTLAFTELGKASFATTRPRVPTDGGCNSKLWKRRYGKLVASLKSKHSFPSGDSAQAMNLCMFLCRYVPLDDAISYCDATLINLVLFGVFVPGVAFARVFYRCHWIEDCIGGILLSLILHCTLIPAIAAKISVELMEPILGYLQGTIDVAVRAIMTALV